MGLFHHKTDEAVAYNEVQSAPREAHLSHELIAGAAAFEAAKAYEEHCEQNGKPSSHAKAKEIIAGITGAFVDREVETRGMNLFDKEKAKHDAKKRAEKALTDAGEY